MEIKFKVTADDLRAALDTIRIVKPMPATQDGAVGYLFVVGKKKDRTSEGAPGPNDGKDCCWVYSRDVLRTARAEFFIHDVEGEGDFVYPADHIEGFKYAAGEIEFTAKSEGESHSVRYSFGKSDKGQANVEHTTWDPKLHTPLDKTFREAQGDHKYQTTILRQALAMSTKFIASDSDRNAKDEHKIVTVYDPTTDSSGKGDGTLSARNSHQAFFFQCDAFKGKGLSLHSQHLQAFNDFISKCGSEVVIKTTKTMLYACTPTDSHVFGCTLFGKSPLEYKYYPRAWDTVVLQVPRDQTLQQLKWIMSQMPKDRVKIKVKYEDLILRFQIIEGGKGLSLPIEVKLGEIVPGTPSNNTPYEYNVNASQFIELIEGAKANDVELRVAPLDEHGGAKNSAGFRTVDIFLLDADGAVVGGSGVNPDPANGTFLCKVTRFMPSMV